MFLKHYLKYWAADTVHQLLSILNNHDVSVPKTFCGLGDKLPISFEGSRRLTRWSVAVLRRLHCEI